MGEGNALAGRGKEEGKKKKRYVGEAREKGQSEVRRRECRREEMRCPVLEPEGTHHPRTVCCQEQMMLVLEVAGGK